MKGKCFVFLLTIVLGVEATPVKAGSDDIVPCRRDNVANSPDRNISYQTVFIPFDMINVFNCMATMSKIFNMNRPQNGFIKKYSRIKISYYLTINPNSSAFSLLVYLCR